MSEENESMKFHADDMPWALFKLAIENNAMLRLVLNNQDRIMNHLGLQPELPALVINDVAPVEVHTEAFDQIPRSQNHIKPVSLLLRDRLWEYLALRL